VKRERVLAAAISLAIGFAFVVGVLGIHKWFGLARALITVALAIWIVLSDWSGRRWLDNLSRRGRGLLRLGVAALIGVEIGRVSVVIAKDGFVTGDAIAIVIDVIVFGYLLQGALVELRWTPGGLLLDAALRARSNDPAKALRLATRTTKLYRKWDEAWLVRAGMVGEQQGHAAQLLVLEKAHRYCPRNIDIMDFLISGLYATGASDEANALLDEYRAMFPRSSRPVLIDAANALTLGDIETARTYLIEAKERAEKEGDAEGLVKIARISQLMSEDDGDAGLDTPRG
jgi:hypothetical protein